MCGINIIINTTNQPVNQALQEMQVSTQYRGPDASQTFEHGTEDWQIVVGVNRLQVVDRDEKSHQPMVSDCGNYVLAYNGEVYNYQDLKNQLIARGYEFKTHSDTEVVLYWLQEHGDKGLPDLKGMFALAFVDLSEGKVVVARDKHGIKPLFYYQASDMVIISSSSKAIEASGLVNLSLNNAALNDYLSYRCVMGNSTFYNEVNSHEPGVVTVYDSRLAAESDKMKSTPYQEDRDLRTSLVDTVSLLFDAPTSPGLMLSGGVDSTLLLAILQKELGVNGVNTFTLNTGVDSKWARKAAIQYGGNHHEISATSDVLQSMDSFLSHTDQPIADHGAFATWLVAREATQSSNILLTGAGADELFGGYNRHRAYYYYLKYYRQNLFVAEFVKRTGINWLFPNEAKQLLGGVEKNPAATYQNFLQNHGIIKYAHFEELWDNPKSLKENLQEALNFDRKNYLVNDVLSITDNSTMQHGVESRVPFLFDDIENQADNISLVEKMKSKGKGPLKDILKGYGGLKYTLRAKEGFGLPLAAWLREKKSNWLWEFLLHDSPLFEILPKSEIYQFLRLHQEGKRDYSMQLWSILVLEKWLSSFYK